MLDRVGTVLLEPCVDDCHQAVNVERQQIVPIRFRYMKSLQNGRQHVLQQCAIAALQPERGGIFHCRSEQAPVFTDVAEIGRQILGRDQIQLLERTIAQTG